VAGMLHDRLRFPTEEPVYGTHAPGTTSPEIKQLECEAGHALLRNARDKNGPTTQRPPEAIGFVRCNIPNDSLSQYPTLCTLVLGGGGYLLLGMILKHSFGKSVYWVYQIDHILIDRRWHSSLIYVRSFRVADFDTDHYLVVAKVRKDWQ